MNPSPRARRAATVLAGLAAGAVLGLGGPLLAAAPAAAHGGAQITVNHDGRGSIWVTVKHDDGHEADDFIDATLRATEKSGTAVDPVKMVQSSSPGTLVYMGTLPSGEWKVDVDFGAPIARACGATFTVGTANRTEAVRCAPPATAAPAEAAPASESGGVDTGSLLLIGFAGIGLVGCAVAAYLLRRRHGNTSLI